MLLQLLCMVHTRSAIRGRLLCRRVRSALFVAGCSSRICVSRSDKKLVAEESVAASKNANWMRVGGRKTPDYFRNLYPQQKQAYGTRAECEMMCIEQESKIPRKPADRDSLTPSRAIHKTCTDCIGTAFLIKDCQGDNLSDGPCLFFRYRLGKGRPSVKLIRKYYLWCMGGSPKLVKDCQSSLTCPLQLLPPGQKSQNEARGTAFFHQDRRNWRPGMVR